MKIKKYLALSLIITSILTLAACSNKEKVTSNEATKQTETIDASKEILKNTTIEGTLSDEEKSKVVELTQAVAKVGIDTDYTKDTLDTVKAVFKYTTDAIAKDYSEETLNKMWDEQKATKQIIKVEGVTFNKISKDSEGKITVDCTIKENVLSHTDPKLNGKIFNNVTARYIFNKEWKITAFAISDFQ